MKKVININFHSRVIPIEETAYEILQQYIASLRRYFANEDGRDEIIGDIENRFAELFSESLKKGAVCITDADVNSVIASMGRPEEFEAEEIGGSTSSTQTSSSTNSQSTGASSTQQGGYQPADEPRRLYRASNDKLLGGVCAGLANYLRIDPVIVRILFILITFGWGTGFLLYIILWAVLPSRELPVNGRKRLYRNPDDRVIAGVASGIAAYFHIEVWIPRLIFCLPLLAGIVTSIFDIAWYDFNGPAIFTGGFGGSLFIAYIVLWMVLPEALTASEKLEMRGEKVDLESIKNTIRSEMEGVKGRAREMRDEMRERATQVGQKIKENTRNFTYEEAAPVYRRTRSGFGHAVGVLFKAFFLFIAGIIAFSLIMVLAALLFRGGGILELKSFILEGFWQNFLAWTSFVLFLVIPVIALLTWLIRRITGTRSKTHYLGYTFATLWVLGLFSTITLVGLVFNNYRSRQHVEEDFNLVQPSHGKIVVNVPEAVNRYHDTDWWSDIDFGEHSPFYGIGNNKFLLTTVRVKVMKSADSSFHVQIVKLSRGSSSDMAKNLAGRIQFPITQNDSVINLPEGFTLNSPSKFRNQQVLVEVAVPVGKRILINHSVEDYNWFDINPNNHHIRWSRNYDGWNSDWNENMDDQETYSWTAGVEYRMTPAGLVELNGHGASYHNKAKPNDNDRDDDDDDKNDDDEDNGGVYKEKKAHPQPGNNDGYRYKGAPQKGADTPTVKRTAMVTNKPGDELSLLSMLIRS